MDKLLFLILLCACNLFLYAQPNIKPIQVENVKLGECLDKAIKNHGLERSLKTAVPDEVYERLKKELEDIEK